MKNLLTLLCCLAFAAGVAEAKTYYVDATRPNNNGNGLKASTAKKTIQAAINIAQAGDTILVYPGTYAPIMSNNKKISIKSVKGSSKTVIARPKISKDYVLAFLGKWTSNWLVITGKNTLLSGFLLDGRDYSNAIATWGAGGGQLKSCVLQRICSSGSTEIAYNSTLTGCIIRNNRDGGIGGNILNRCKVTGNENCSFWRENYLANCLVTGNKGWGRAYLSSGGFYYPSLFEETILVNCTVVKNCTWHSSGGEARPLFSYKSKFYNCILRNNYRRVKDNAGNGKWLYGKIVIHNTDTAAGYKNTYSRTFLDNRDPKFTDPDKGDFTLKKGSSCINKGILTDSLKKIVGTLDMGGRTRLRGSAIDLGCYEY